MKPTYYGNISWLSLSTDLPKEKSFFFLIFLFQKGKIYAMM